MTISKDSPRYQSYLLRFWEEPSQQSTETVWRFSLEDPRTRHRRGFASFEAMVTALKIELMDNQEVHLDVAPKDS